MSFFEHTHRLLLLLLHVPRLLRRVLGAGPLLLGHGREGHSPREGPGAPSHRAARNEGAGHQGSARSSGAQQGDRRLLSHWLLLLLLTARLHSHLLLLLLQILERLAHSWKKRERRENVLGSGIARSRSDLPLTQPPADLFPATCR